MSMPKGHKSKFGYATVDSRENCLGYREIAEIMTANGDKMNHSTARNVFLKAMSKVANPVVKAYGNDQSDDISQDPRFQACVHEIINDLINN